MADHVFVVLTNPTEGNEDAYNDWYDNVHLAEVTAIPGFVSAQRFKLSDAQYGDFADTAKYRYLAIYEIDGDPKPTFDRLTAEMETGRMVMPPSLDMEDLLCWAYTPSGDVFREQDAAAGAAAST